MNLDEITDIEWLRKELKRFCVYVKKDINEHLKSGKWYPVDYNEAGAYISDWNYKYYFDIFLLEHPEEYLEEYK